MFRALVLICCMCLTALTPFLTMAMTPEQKAKIHAHFEEVGARCFEHNPITEDDINHLREHQLPSGPNVPCFIACVLKDVGVMDQNGQLQKESILDLARQVFEDEEELKNIEDYLHSCSHINLEPVSDGTKGCERAVLAYKCMTENASKFDFEV